MKIEEFVGSNERNLNKQESIGNGECRRPRNIPFKNKKFDEFIEEGINFNKKSMTVWFTPTEERYVDTSLENFVVLSMT